jgi:hypothetical protein
MQLVHLGLHNLVYSKIVNENIVNHIYLSFWINKNFMKMQWNKVQINIIKKLYIVEDTKDIANIIKSKLYDSDNFSRV